MSGPSRSRCRPREERGTALVEVVWLGALLILPLLWIVVAVAEVQSGAFGTTAAARAAGRAYAVAPDEAAGMAAARAAARQALADQGLSAAPMGVLVTCTPGPGRCHDGESVITARVESMVALPLLPDLFGAGRPSVALDATHTLPVGRYRELR